MLFKPTDRSDEEVRRDGLFGCRGIVDRKPLDEAGVRQVMRTHHTGRAWVCR